MSGGYFNSMWQSSEEIEKELLDIIAGRKHGAADTYFPKTVLEKFDVTLYHISEANKMVHLIDNLLSGDDSIETFLERWQEDIIGKPTMDIAALYKELVEETLSRVLAKVNN